MSGTRRPGSIDGLWRVLAPSIGIWGVAAVAVAMPGSGAWIGAASVLCGVLAAVIAYAVGRRDRSARRKPGLLGSRALGAVLVGAAGLLLLSVRLVGLEEDRRHPGLNDAADRGRSATVDVQLSAYPGSRVSEDGTRSWLRGTVDAAPILVWIDGAADPRWGPGSRIRVTGAVRAQPPESDAAFEIAARGAVESIPGTLDAAVSTLAEARARLVAAAARVPGAELVPGFAVGDTSPIPELLGERMRATSLTHLTAVSGSNCALVVGAIAWTSARFGAGRRTRVVLSAAALVGFVALIGPDASVQRAAIMAGVMLASRFGGVPGSGLPALGAAVLFLLVADPWESRQAGFGLSVLATGGVLLLAPAIEERLRRFGRLPRVLALPIAMSVAAQVACGPGLLLIEPGIPLAGILANLLAAPAAPIGTGVGLIAVLLLGISAPAGGAAVVVASWASSWVAAVAEVCATLPLARLEWPGGWSGALLLVVVQCAPMIAAALRSGALGLPGGARARRRAPWRPAPPKPRAVRVAIALLASGAGGISAGITVAAPIAERAATPRDWAFVACDVGQGDALLVRDPRAPDSVVLVDTGDEPERLSECLRRFGVGRIRLLVLTHDDRDHVGALARVIDRVESAIIAPPVGQPVGGAAGQPRQEPCASDERVVAERRVLRELCAAGIPVELGEAGRRLALPRNGESASGSSSGPGSSALEVSVLAPSVGQRPADTNGASLVLRARASGFAMLLLADTGREEQATLLRERSDLSADLVKIAHHGSRDHDPRLASAVGAGLAVVSVGAGNRYGHPTAEAISSYEQAGSTVLRTDRHGSIAISPGDGGAAETWVERGDEDAGSRAMSAGCSRLEGWQRQRAEPRARSLTWAGSRRAPRPSYSSADPSRSSPTAPLGPSATSSKPRFPRPRSTTSRLPATPRARSSRSRAPPSSPNPDSSGSTGSRSAPTRSSPT